MNKIILLRLLGKIIRLFSRKAYFWFILRIFSTPPKNRKKARLSPPANMEVSTEIIGENAVFTLYKKLDTHKVILFAHGWGGEFQNFRYLFQPALDQGYSIMGFDAPAHGHSSGKSTHILVFKDIIKSCLQKVTHFEEIVVVGHSLGGAASILAIMESTDIRISRFYPMAMPGDLRKVLMNYMTLMKVSSDDEKDLVEYTRQHTGLDFDLYNWKYRSLPSNLDYIKLIHGKKDMVVKQESCLSLARSWSLNVEQDVLLIDEASHHNILKNKTAIAEIFAPLHNEP